ncbi:MAG: PP2C family protein-serine/threonine phosphatase [Thermoanaerobaculia bacterium]
MTLTKTFRRSGLVFLAGVVLLLAGAAGAPGGFWTPAGTVLCIFAGPVFLVSALRHLMRGLLWRVGSRLLVSYLLLVVPFACLFGVVYAGVWLVAAEVGGKRLEFALEKLTDSLGRTARTLAEELPAAATSAERTALFEKTISTFGAAGDMGYSWRKAGGKEETFRTPDGASLLPRSWIRKGSVLYLVRDAHGTFFAAIENGREGTLVLTLRAGPALRAALERELGMELDIRRPRPVTTQEGPAPKGRTTLSLGRERFDLEKTEEAAAVSAAPPAGSGPIQGRWVLYPVSVAVDYVDWATGEPLPEERSLFILQTSVAVEATELFGDIRIGSRAARSADVALAVMKSLGISAAGVFLLATLLAAILALRISRATRRLSQGVAEIEKGNFSHRVVLRGNDQLSRLVGGFNEMASHLEASVHERAEKTALERELALARDLQRRLLPPADFSYPGVEIAIDFHPAAAIGGDFYDLVASDPPGVLTVVLADVSGHGLPTGIVMASARASLRALVQAGASGADLLTRLDTEIARTTETRTFVTMAILTFSFAAKRVAYTNAGHLYPYRVTPAGVVSPLVNPARPLGLGLPAVFRSVEAPLEAGDLWALLSDGIVEATRSGTDEEFGFPRLESVLAGASGGTAVAARDRILAAWREFTGSDEPADDRTLIVLRIGSAAPHA